MHVEEARTRVYHILAAHRQNRVLLDHSDADPSELQAMLAEAAESITYGMIDECLRRSESRASIGEGILAAYSIDWSSVENGKAWVNKIVDNVACNLQIAEVARALELGNEE